MPCIELGGNFCLSEKQFKQPVNRKVAYDNSLLGWTDVMFTHGGRSAIISAVRDLGLGNSLVFIPNFSCHSITDAFNVCGCTPYYYKTNRDLTIDVESLLAQIREKKPAVLYTCPLFGFDTILMLRPHYKEIKALGVKIIEDVTHSLFSSNATEDADKVVCSLRKWLEIPDGGFLTGIKAETADEFYADSPSPAEIVDNFRNASECKFRYLQTNDDSLKETFLPLFYKNNEIFGETEHIFKMSDFSYRILKEADKDKIASARRRNYKQLLKEIKNPLVEFIFPELPDGVVPLYMQIYVKDGHRNDLQKHLIRHKLYCPIIWGTPQTVIESCDLADISNHKDMLSLVVDQRYDEADMSRLANCINEFN